MIFNLESHCNEPLQLGSELDNSMSGGELEGWTTLCVPAFTTTVVHRTTELPDEKSWMVGKIGHLLVGPRRTIEALLASPSSCSGGTFH